MSQKETSAKGAGVEVTARAIVRLHDQAACEQARAALAPESEGFLGLEVHDAELHLHVPTGSTGRVLATWDDALACLQTALGSKAAAVSEKGRASQHPRGRPPAEE